MEAPRAGKQTCFKFSGASRKVSLFSHLLFFRGLPHKKSRGLSLDCCENPYKEITQYIEC